MKLLKFPVFLFAICIAIASAFAANVKSAKPASFDATYYYIGSNTLAQMQTPSNWLNSGTACNPSGTKPCTINWVGSRSAFDTHVAAFPSTTQVVSECATKKP